MVRFGVADVRAERKRLLMLGVPLVSVFQLDHEAAKAGRDRVRTRWTPG
jgi:hypothetical protein